MIVLPRSSDAAGDGGQIGSPRVATSTVIGMVLGILCKTKVPSSALISPWSPSEYEFPYPSPHSQGFMSPGVPATPPPLYPPPPAYIPETPLRSPRSAFASPSRSDLTKIQSPKVTVLPPLPISPIVSKLEKEIVGEIDTWTALSQRDWHESHADGVFVISNDSEDETWEVDSIKSDRILWRFHRTSQRGISAAGSGA